jgi:hypothetical protein
VAVEAEAHPVGVEEAEAAEDADVSNAHSWTYEVIDIATGLLYPSIYIYIYNIHIFLLTSKNIYIRKK